MALLETDAHGPSGHGVAAVNSVTDQRPKLRVIQRKSAIGTTSRRLVERDLRNLGLGKPNREAQLPLLPGIIGTLRKRVRPLVDVGWAPSTKLEVAPDWQPAMRTFEYPIEAGGALLYFHGPDDGPPNSLPVDRFQLEPYREEAGDLFLSVSWSTSLSWAKTDQALDLVLAQLRGEGEAVYLEGDDLQSIGRHPASPVQLVDLRARLSEAASKTDGTEQHDPVRFVRIDMGDHSIIWTRHDIERSTPGEVGYETESVRSNTFAVLFGTWDQHYLQVLIERTATPLVIHDMPMLLEGYSKWKGIIRDRPVQLSLR